MKKIFDQLVKKMRFEINKLSERIDFDNLTYHQKGKRAPKSVLKIH